MERFVVFEAKGYIFDRDKDGKVITGSVDRTRYGSGVVKSGYDELGKIIRQCPWLAACDAVSYNTYNL